MTISRINIELLHKTLRKKIPVIQNDTGRKLECTVTDCKLTSEIKARIWAMNLVEKWYITIATLRVML